MINHRFPNKNIKWNDFQIDWKNILSDVKRLRMEKIMLRFNNREIVEDLDDLK